MSSDKPSKSSFQFEGFNITKSIFEKKGEEVGKELSLAFSPVGKFDKKSKKFHLFLGLLIEDKEKQLKIEVESESIFCLDSLEDENLNNYLYTNAPAILFPYLRAYISTLTALSGFMSPLLLPTMNLSQLAEDLQKNTEFVD